MGQLVAVKEYGEGIFLAFLFLVCACKGLKGKKADALPDGRKSPSRLMPYSLFAKEGEFFIA